MMTEVNQSKLSNINKLPIQNNQFHKQSRSAGNTVSVKC